MKLYHVGRHSVIRAIVILLFIMCPLNASPLIAPNTKAGHKGTTSECRNVSDVLGFAVVDVEDGTVLPFFAKPDSSEAPALKVRLFQDQAINSINYRVEGAGPFRPATLHLDYHLFELSVKNRRHAWLRVVVDEQTGKTLWMREREGVRFVRWLSYMRSAFSIARTDQKINQLLTDPFTNARKVRLRGRDCFKVERMRGDWIRVVQQEHCDEIAETAVRGWVRWRGNRGCLLVHIFPFA
jgi:hypothetical protein